MKRLCKVIAVFSAITMLLTTGIPVFATDYDHVQSGYGAQGATDLGNAVWSLNVSPYLANSTGSLINGYTGNVFCGITVNGIYHQSTGTNYNSLQYNGNGSWAEVYFYNIVSPPVPITDTADQRTGSGVKSGSTSQISWYIEAATTFATSTGSVSSGYTGMVFCGISVNGNWYETDVVNSNSLSMLGSDTYAEIWIR